MWHPGKTDVENLSSVRMKSEGSCSATNARASNPCQEGSRGKKTGNSCVNSTCVSSIPSTVALPARCQQSHRPGCCWASVLQSVGSGARCGCPARGNTGVAWGATRSSAAGQHTLQRRSVDHRNNPNGCSGRGLCAAQGCSGGSVPAGDAAEGGPNRGRQSHKVTKTRQRALQRGMCAGGAPQRCAMYQSLLRAPSTRPRSSSTLAPVISPNFCPPL